MSVLCSEQNDQLLEVWTRLCCQWKAHPKALSADGISNSLSQTQFEQERNPRGCPLPKESFGLALEHPPKESCGPSGYDSHIDKIVGWKRLSKRIVSPKFTTPIKDHNLPVPYLLTCSKSMRSKYQWMEKEEHSTTYISNDSSGQSNTSIYTSTLHKVVPNYIRE